MTWNASDPEGNEAAKVKYDVVPYTRGKVLDLGCGIWRQFPHWTGVDQGACMTQEGVAIPPDLVADCSKLDMIEDGSCNVFSSHLLEHIQDYRAALRDWWRCIKVGGYLVLYLPHRDLYPNIGQPGSNPDHKHDFVPHDILSVMADVVADAGTGMDVLVNQPRHWDAEYSFLQVFQKTAAVQGEDRIALSYAKPRPEKTACVVRYGGFGDMLQAANILPELKRQGYHVTVMTTPKGQEVLRDDPHVDAFQIQDDDQVPNNELPEFWAVQAKHFDKFIQLSESVEGTLLAMPGRSNHMWPDAVRRKELGKNYLEWTAQLAELPYASESKFYPSEREQELVGKWLARVKGDAVGPLAPLQRTPEQFVIVWCLSGSAMHKSYPHQDGVIANVLANFPDAVVILTGDMMCKVLEAGWEDHPRVKCASGELGIRETLTLAQMADCVVGPETGVLNAVAFEPMGKVILLSHSSPENLTKHWVNTDVMTPANTSCYPCHRLHMGMAFCREDPDTGCAACQADIAPPRVFEAIGRHYDQWTALRRLRMAV